MRADRCFFFFFCKISKQKRSGGKECKKEIKRHKRGRADEKFESKTIHLFYVRAIHIFYENKFNIFSQLGGSRFGQYFNN